MGMNLGSGGASAEAEVMVDINTTPLIDVMLVLLIMLIITIPIQLHSVNMNMPHGNPPPAVSEPVVVRIDVDFDGTVLWDGEALSGHAVLEEKLKQTAAMPDQPEVHLRPNKLAAYRHVAAVMAAAQRLNVTRIGIVGNEQFVK